MLNSLDDPLAWLAMADSLEEDGLDGSWWRNPSPPTEYFQTYKFYRLWTDRDAGESEMVGDPLGCGHFSYDIRYGGQCYVNSAREFGCDYDYRDQLHNAEVQFPGILAVMNLCQPQETTATSLDYRLAGQEGIGYTFSLPPT